ncbi:hypothetical protein [Sphingomonas sp. T9W2]|uniref:hypothetical protein n=1 Tax=Sphingomonas sp. T9W2 TaxID=3143183 RepID=UPI0031F5C6FE
MKVAGSLPRTVIAEITSNPRAAAALESLAQQVDDTTTTTQQTIADTQALQDATFLTLSGNATLTAERVLTQGSGVSFRDADGRLTVSLDQTAVRTDGAYPVSLLVDGPTRLFAPQGGTLATQSNRETFQNKTLEKPLLSGIENYADDAAAGAGGVPVGGVYRTGSTLKVRAG